MILKKSMSFAVMLSMVFSGLSVLVPDSGQSNPSSSGTGGLADSPWPMLGHNLFHTGLSPYDTSTNPGKLKWSFTTGADVYSSPAIGSDGTIYVGSRDNMLYAINPDGTEKWKFPTGDCVDSSPAIGSDGTIYVGSDDNRLYAINPDGTQKWNFLTGHEVHSSPAIGSDGTIYVGSHDHKLYAINPDGTEKWSFLAGDNIRNDPAIGSDGTIYIGSYDFKLYAINPDGTEKWNFTTGDKISHSSPAIGSDGTIYIGSDDEKLYAINPDGTEKWNFPAGERVASCPSFGPDGTIYFGNDINKFNAINPDGTEKWRYWTSKQGLWYSSAAIGSDGTIYVGFDDDNIYAFNPDGTVKWNITTGGDVRASPAIGPDGTIYVGSQDHKLYAIGTPTQNQPPVADAGPDHSVNEGEVVELDGSASYDPGGTIEIYEWDFESDGIYDYQETPTNAPDGAFDGKAMHIYGDNGIYTATLRVTDDTGAIDTDTCIVTAKNVVPTISSVSSPLGNEGSIITFTSTANDPGSDDLTFTWNWGDGTSPITTDYYNDGVNPEPIYDPSVNHIKSPWGTCPFEVTDSVQHTYGDNGVYTITLEVKDDDAGTSVINTTIIVNNVAPAIILVITPSGYEGSSLTFEAEAYDPGSDDLTFTWEFDLGPSISNPHYNDGVNPEPAYDPVTNEVKSPWGTYPFTANDTVSHIYGDNGVYDVTVTVEDDDGGTEVVTTTVTVYNIAPTITMVIAPSGDEGSSLIFEAEATDPGSDDLTFSWEFEYGPTTSHIFYNNGLSPDPSQSPLGTYPFSASDTVTHTYGDNYNYTLDLRVEDDDGGVALYSTIISVDNIAPSITEIIIPYPAEEGIESTFRATAKDEGSDDLTFEWDFGDLTSMITNSHYNDGINPDPYPSPDGLYPFSAQDTVNHTYGDNYNYTLILKITDDDGGMTTFSTVVIVNNIDPIIEPFGPFSIDEGSPLDITATCKDPGSDDLTFIWEFEYGPTITNVHYNDGADPDPYPSPWGTYPFSVADIAEHTYGDNGMYTLTLIVEDDDGGSTVYITNITVNNVAPTVDALSNATIDEGGAVTFPGHATDPGSDDLTFTWGWSDGSSDTVTIYYNDPPIGPDPYPSPEINPRNITEMITHTYGDNGVYTITLTVEDDDGGITTVTTIITVNNVAPTIDSFGPFTIDEGSPIAVTATANDPGSDDLQFEWEFEFGPIITNVHYNDGIGPDPYPSPWGTFPFSATDTVTHTYGDNYVYAVTLTVTDDDGGVAAYSTTVTVDNVAPQVDSLPALIIYEGEMATFSGHATDPGSDDLTFTWNWGYVGFGNTINTYLNNPPGSDPFPSPEVNPRDVTDTVSQTYGDNGDFIITLTVTDDDGGATTVTTTVTVDNVAPQIVNIEAYMRVNFILRVAGEKWHSVNLILYENDDEIWNVKVTRQPGSPDEQAASLTDYSINLENSYKAIVDYLPNDPRMNGNVWGGNPVWIILEFQDGTSERLHHTFNVRKSYWDSDHWNHIDPWEVNLTGIIYRHNITFEATAIDPGSDDLTFVWDFGDGGTAGPNTYYNNGMSPDPFPSPEVNPMNVTNTVTHAYSASGTYTVTLTVMDDDGGIALTTLIMLIG